MIPREVTVGRATDNDIQVSPQCMTVSNYHALIYSNGNQLIYKDVSTNGTWINGMKVHRQAITLHYGDIILLAGKYQLGWDKLSMYFPVNDLRTSAAAASAGGTIVGQGGQQGYQQQPPHSSQNEYAGNNPLNSPMPKSTSGYNVDVEITRFNWGAFFLYPYWGFANGMWWLFFLSLVIAWLSPIPNIVFGVMGSKWAWKAKQWRDIDHFVEVQRSWKKWGIGLFLVSVALLIIWLIVVFAFASSFVSAFY